MKELTILDSFISFRKKRGFEISNVILQWLNNVSLNGFRKTNSFLTPETQSYLKHIACQGVSNISFLEAVNYFTKSSALEKPSYFLRCKKLARNLFRKRSFFPTDLLREIDKKMLS